MPVAGGCYRQDQQGGLCLGDTRNLGEIPMPDIVLADGSSNDQDKVGAISLLRMLTTYDANIRMLTCDLKSNNVKPTMHIMHDEERSII